jgi:hypothetical protein
MIIKHVIELETVINEEVNEVSVYKIKGMSEENRQEFFTEAAKEMIGAALVKMNEGNTWAILRVAEEQSV